MRFQRGVAKWLVSVAIAVAGCGLFVPAAAAIQLANDSPLPPATVNSPYTLTFIATGGAAGGYSFAIISGALPLGLSLSSTGVLSGTPTAAGTSHFTVQAMDLQGNAAARDYSMAVLPAALAISTASLPSTQVNSALSIQFVASGGKPPYSWTEAGALPPGTAFGSDGLLSGTPTATGSFSLVVTVGDSAGAAASGKFTISITLPPLQITTASLPSGQVFTPYSTQVAATGGKPPYIWSATGLPAGLDMANTTGLISGVPHADGTFHSTVAALDSLGQKVSQVYTIVIAPSKLSLTVPSLPNGDVGTPYAAVLTAAGGDGPYTYGAAGLPPGITVSGAGKLSGVPTTAGSFTVNVTVKDANGLTAAGAFPVVIAPALVIAPVTMPGGIVGTALASTQLAAAGGTPPYQWQSSSLPAGLSLSLDGTLSGAPTTAGTFSFVVFVADSTGASASATVQITVVLPPEASFAMSGLPDTAAPASQQNLQVSLGSAYPVTLQVKLTLSFTPDSGADDPSVQFASGGRTAQTTIVAGSTAALSNFAIQTGTVAGTIVITAQLVAGTQDVTPSPAPKRSVRINAAAPVITSISISRTAAGFTVVIVGYASSREVTTANFQFSGSTGSNLLTNQASVPVSALFSQWFGNSASASYGSQFSFTQPFTVQGSSIAGLSVTAVLANSVGNSAPATANLQ